MVSSTNPHFFSSTRDDEYDLCPSCSVHTNRGTACVLIHVLPFLLQWVCFLDLLSLSSLLFLLLLLLQLLLLHLSSHPHVLQYRSTLAMRSFFTLIAALRPWSHKFVCDTQAAHCPCQLKTGRVSSRHTHMSMHISMVYIPLFTSSLMTVPSRLFRMCGFFSSSTTTLPACTNGLEWNGFLLVRSSFTLGNISASMKCPAVPVSIVAPMFAQLSLTSMTFLGDALELFTTLSNDSWANFFNFNCHFLLVTSCHRSFSLSSSKHHAFNSPSSSRTSSLMSCRRPQRLDSCSNSPW